MAKFVVTVVDPKTGNPSKLFYDNVESTLSDETGLSVVQVMSESIMAARSPVARTSKSTPVGKTSPRVLKISLGLSCNYECEYCSQRFVPRSQETNPEDIQSFIDGLDSWIKEPPEKVEFWGGESHVQKEWNAEKSKNEQITAKLEQHVEDVKLMQTQINQEITNDFLKKSKLLADRLPDPRVVGVCNITATGNGSVSAVPDSPIRTDATSANPIPVTQGNVGDVSCLQLSKDAAQTTLMLVEFQRWYQKQSSVDH